MADFRKGISVHGGGAEGDIVTLDENLEIKTSGMKINEIANKTTVEAIQTDMTAQGTRIDALEESMGEVLNRLIDLNGEE